MKALTIFSLVLGAVFPALATDWRVPQDFAQVSVALEAAVAGDTILVSPGSYDDAREWAFPKNITVKNVTVKGTGSSSAEVVCLVERDEGYMASVILGSNCRLENLTIDSVRANTLCAIRPDSTGVVIRNVVLNVRRYDGICSYGTVEVEISNVTLRAEGNFGKTQTGIWTTEDSIFLVRNCLFKDLDEGFSNWHESSITEYHNCFDNVKKPFYFERDPDPTDIIGPSGVGGWPYVPPYGSIVIDAGDPSGFDPDGTLPDIGAVRYNQTSHLIGFGETPPVKLPGTGSGGTSQIFRAGDRFILWSVVTKPVGYPLVEPGTEADIYLILDVYGEMWFWPSWSEEIDFNTVDLFDGYYNSEPVLDFTWPVVGGSASGLRFWASTLMTSTEDYRVGPIAMLEFGYE
jgi:hypothetical protein